MRSGLSIRFAARNLIARRLTSALTIAGMALVAFVFGIVLMMSAGLRETLGSTGSPSNVVVIRQGSPTEVQSTITRDQAGNIESMPGLATGEQGQPMVSREVLVLVNMPRRGRDGVANIVVRGTTANGLALRPQAKLVDGRAFQPGSSEVMIGSALARGNIGLRIGDRIEFGLRHWTVVGVFGAGNSGFDSEIWGDSNQMMQAFRRQAFSSLVVGLRDSDTYGLFSRALAQRNRLGLEAKPETKFYADQSEGMARFISVLGQTISVIFSIGAIIGATITMYASVASRTREIGTLRALGFRRSSILASFLQEALLLGFVAGVVGLAAAASLQRMEISTTNIQTLSEVVFRLTLTPAIAVQVLLFSVFMGALGGLLPANRASRLQIVDALRN
ncbi:MAG: FtsX-like permease family protein [Rhizobiaceae bacterium]